MTNNHLLFKQFLTFTTAILLMFQAQQSFAQLTGVKTIPGDYATIALAVTDLNTQGVGAGGVVFNIAAGHSETLAGKITLTATGTAANPITFQKSGAGLNPILTAYVGTVATPSVIADGFWVLAGSDYVTIDGIDLQENAANTTTTTVMEFGYGLFKSSTTDGCQNNIIRNCNITLNRLQNTTWTAPGHNGSTGIAVLNGLHTATGALTISAASGSNSFNQFYSNTIQNCNAGIVFVGFADVSPFTFGDSNNDVGGSSLATGNNILNFGGGATANPATGILASAQWGFNVSYNTINNNNGSGVNHATTMRGIYLNGSSTSASANCNFNSITLTGGATTSDLTFIENGFGSTPAGNTVNINSNNLTGSYLTATTGAFRGIYSNAATPATLNILNNTINNLSYSSIANTGTGTVYAINTSGSNAAMTINANGNTVSNISRIGTTGGTTIGLFISAGVNNMTVNANNNIIQNISIDGTGTASILYGMQTSTGTVVMNNNLVENLTCIKTTGTSAMYGIYNVASPVDETYNNNIIRNLNHNGTGVVYGLFANTAAGTRIVSNNLIHGLTSGGTTIAGMNMALSSPNVFNNKVYDIQSLSIGAPIVSGILLTSVSTNGTANIYNNYVGDLRAPNATSTSASLPSVRGINITATSATTTINVSFNTVHLNAVSTGVDFGTAGLFATTSATATTATLNLRNNVIVNLSTANGIYNTVAYQRSTAALNNYGTVSNNNLFYAGTPGPQNLIFSDGTNNDQLLANFKCRVSPREALSVTENPSFLSTLGANANFLHINPAIATQIEGGAVNIAGISTDFDNDIRQGNAGYSGTGIAPDMGADEGNFIAVDQVAPTINYTLIASTICTSNPSLSAVITDPSNVNSTAGTKPRLWFKKASENNVLAASNTSADNGWKWVEANNAISPFNFSLDYSLLNSAIAFGDVIEYFVVAQDLATTPNVGANIVNFNTCGVPSTVALAAPLFPVSNVSSFNIISPPNPVPASASPATLCFSGDATLTLGTVLGAEYQWQSSAAGANTWTSIPGANAINYTATGLNSSMDFRCVISCNSIPVVGVSPSATTTVVVSSPQVLTTIPGSDCSSSAVSVLLSGTKNAGSILNWYSAPTGGLPIASGDTFNTPLISNTTTYYVAASQGGGGGTFNLGLPAALSTPTSGIGTTSFGIVFDALTPFTLKSVVVYAIAATAGTSGTVTIDVIDANNVVLHTATVAVTGNPTAQAAGDTVQLNFNILPGSNLKLRHSARSTGITGLLFEPSASAPAGNYGYPFSIPGVLTLNHSTLTAAPTNTPRLDLYYYFYNWEVIVGCESPRIPVVATITNTTATGTDVQSACGSYTWINGTTYTASNSTATFTLAGAALGGCDSIVTLNLTITPAATGTDVQTACSSYTWINGTTYTTSNSTATFTLAGGATNGCDSIVTLNLTITPAATGTDVQTACGSYTWINGTTYTASNSTATFTLAGGAASGCDSIVTLNLTINNTATGTDVQSACGSYTWINGTTYTASNSTATFTIVGGAASGCDSIVTLNLTINNTATGTDVQTACGSYTWINGTTYTASNSTATFTIAGGAASGCDSVVTLNLTINTVNVTVTNSAPTLTANATGASYQWLNCDNNNSPIATEIGQSFTATSTGNYAVAVTENGCTDTSACINVVVVSVDEIAFESSLSLYPNPTTGMFFIDLGTSYNNVTVSVKNALGQEISTTQYNAASSIQMNLDAVSGIYFIVLTADNGKKASFKLIKQ